MNDGPKTDCDTIKDLLEPYALDALDPDERTLVSRHIADCRDCRLVLDEYREIVATLPEALAAASSQRVPDSLKDKVLGRLQTSSPDATSQAVQSYETPSPTPGPTDNGWSSQNWRQARPLFKRSAFRIGWMRVAALGLGVLLVLAVSWSVQLQSTLAKERALRLEFADLVDQQEVVLEVIDSDKTVRRVLLGPEPVEGSVRPPYGKLFTRSDLPHVVAMAARLPQPPPGQAYHLWLTAKGRTTLAGKMRINEDGFALLVFDADRDGPHYGSAQLTLQPIGTDSPSDEIILEWEN